jgi:two-component system nitrogen regulation response regulator GlnG
MSCWSRSSLSKHIILFLAANPVGTTELALGREARAIQEELERSGQRDRFEFVTRWAVQPLDLIRELRKLKPTVVHFTGHGGSGGRQQGAGPYRDVVTEPGGDDGTDDSDHKGRLFFQGSDGRPQLVGPAAFQETFGAAGTSVKLVVLNACYSNAHAEALLVHIDCVVGMSSSLRDNVARTFAIGFYGGLGERQSVAAAYLQGCAAISLEEPPNGQRPQLKVRDGVDANQVVLGETNAIDLGRPIPAYPDAEVEQLSKRLEGARERRDKLRGAGIGANHIDREILELRRELREGGRLRPGDTLGDGRYLLVKVVGFGGFAAVWEAYDCAAQQRVAIKVLHTNVAGDPQRRERFFRGARAMMRLTHRAVTRVLEPKGEDGGFYYFVMEFVPGWNLREAVLERRVKDEDMLPLILRVGEALALAHAGGMIHRDIKPSNILIGEAGDAKLTDFDLVSAHDTTGGTRTGALGTVVYAAPECLDKPQEATTRADVYGLGMTAIFCLSGRDLSMDTFRNPEGTIFSLGCSRRVQDVLRQAVAWEPDERFADAAAMVIELRNALNSPDRGEVAFARSDVSSSARLADLPALVPTLTIVSHPLSHRVGEQCRLDAVALGREVSLSRNAPDFTRPGNALGGPLGDPFVSRRPIRFAPGADGGIRVLVPPGSTPVCAGSRVDDATFTPDEIAHGVPLKLAEHVVLLLHMDDRAVKDAANPLGMVGASVGIRRVRVAIERLADLTVPVLIRGETGTGKELVARAIHDRRPSPAGPFVSINLCAIPPESVAAQLFGWVRGAFVEAKSNRAGAFRIAHGGTLFLDEVGEASPAVQLALLRTLETGKIYPIGEPRSLRVNVRLIVATDANLEDQIQQGKFKAPLLHKFEGYEVRLPPLRERREDIGPLFFHFARGELEAIGERHRLSPHDPHANPWLPAPLAAQLVRYPWPGNVRELRNVTRQLVIESRGLPQLRLESRLADQLGVAASPSSSSPPQPSSDSAIDVPRPPLDPAISVQDKEARFRWRRL